MRWRKNWYTAHRWIGLVVGVQLLAWSVGGLVFSLLDIEAVRGHRERVEESPPPLDTSRVSLSPDEAFAAARAGGISTDDVSALRIRPRFGRVVYELLDAKGACIGAVDAESGGAIPTITAKQAEQAALRDFEPEAAVVSVTLLEGDAPSEYRGGPMPVYRVDLDHPGEPHLYVSPVTGDVLKRRNKLWRWFDFFWMLHIMDYKNRESINHWLLTGASVLAVLTSASGLGLWWWRLPRRRPKPQRPM
jgi:uncharacterized iron-regulated membrane protein